MVSWVPSVRRPRPTILERCLAKSLSSSFALASLSYSSLRVSAFGIFSILRVISVLELSKWQTSLYRESWLNFLMRNSTNLLWSLFPLFGLGSSCSGWAYGPTSESRASLKWVSSFSCSSFQASAAFSSNWSSKTFEIPRLSDKAKFLLPYFWKRIRLTCEASAYELSWANRSASSCMSWNSVELLRTSSRSISR